MRSASSIALLWSLPAITALLGLAGLGFWILGIPGDPEAAYARPWLIGLLSLIAYPAIFALILILRLMVLAVRLPIDGRHFALAAWLAWGYFRARSGGGMDLDVVLVKQARQFARRVIPI